MLMHIYAGTVPKFAEEPFNESSDHYAVTRCLRLRHWLNTKYSMSDTEVTAEIKQFKCICKGSGIKDNLFFLIWENTPIVEILKIIEKVPYLYAFSALSVTKLCGWEDNVLHNVEQINEK